MSAAYWVGSRDGTRAETGNLLAALLLVGGSLNGLAVRVLESWQLHGLDSPFFGVSPFEVLAIVVGARAILATSADTSIFYPWPEILLGAALLVPSSALAWFCVAAYGLTNAWQATGERRTGYLIFAALAGCSIWSSVLLKYWAGPASVLDARAVWSILSLIRADIEVTGNVVGVPTGHNLIIMTACTSASLLPKALLGLTALAVLAGGVKGNRLALGVAAVAAASIAINVLRLAIMASSADLYALVHGPIGANGFDLAQTLSVIGLGLWVTRS